MTTKNLHIMGVVPYEETISWCVLTVSRASVFGDEVGKILEWGWGKLEGFEEVRAILLARLCREIQSLDYKTGVALIIANDPGEEVDSERLAAMLSLLAHQKLLSDSTINFWNLYEAREIAADQQLRRWGLYAPGDDQVSVHDATCCALAGLRYARQSRECANVMWPEY